MLVRTKSKAVTRASLESRTSGLSWSWSRWMWEDAAEGDGDGDGEGEQAGEQATGGADKGGAAGGVEGSNEVSSNTRGGAWQGRWDGGGGDGFIAGAQPASLRGAAE